MPTWFKRVTHVSIKVSVNLNMLSLADHLKLDTVEMEIFKCLHEFSHFCAELHVGILMFGR